LSGREHLAGDSFTVADLNVASLLLAPERRALAGASARETGVQTHVGFAGKSVWRDVTALALRGDLYLECLGRAFSVFNRVVLAVGQPLPVFR
jgi:hypothetical protein